MTYLYCDQSLPPKVHMLHTEDTFRFTRIIRVRLAYQYFKLVIEIDATNILCRGSSTNKYSDVLTIDIGWYERVIPCEVFQDSVLEAGFEK